MTNLEELGAILGGLAALVGALAGLWKIIAGGRRNRDDRPLRTYRTLAADLRVELNQVQEDRKRDRERGDALEQQYQRDKLEQEARFAALEHRQAASAQQVGRLVIHIRYLRSLLAVHAPDVVLEPMPTELE